MNRCRRDRSNSLLNSRLSLLHKKGIQLIPKENYFINVEHAMRNADETVGVERLEGVLDVGYKFEKER